MLQRYAAEEMHAKSLLSQAATALKLGKSWPEGSPYREELALLQESDGLHLDSDTRGKAGEENDWWELLKIKDRNARRKGEDT